MKMQNLFVIMHSSFTGQLSCRSKSSQDVFRQSSPERNQSQHSFSTLQRPRHPPPAPPVRKDTSTSEPRSYLTRDIRQEYQLGFEQQQQQQQLREKKVQEPEQPLQSPSRNNFVKRLVAALERRQMDIWPRASPALSSDKLARAKVRQDRHTVPGTKLEKLEREEVFVDRLKHNPVLGRLPPRELEDLYEATEDEGILEKTSTYTSLSDDELKYHHHDFTSSLPAHFDRNYSIESFHCNNNNKYHKDKDNLCEGEEDEGEDEEEREGEEESSSKGDVKPSKARRTLRGMLTSLLSWRGAKSLPKGTRDYYAMRESLGEEMRTFRRDTMPRLLERSPSIDDMAVELHRQRQEFARMIEPAIQEDPESEHLPSHATIHPIYGANAVQQRLSRFHDSTIGFDKSSEYSQATKIAQTAPLPPLPPRHSSPPVDQSLMRPSQIRDLERQLTREHEPQQQVQLRHRPVSVVYDVPRSANLTVEKRLLPTTTHHYTNVADSINDDKRLRRAVFTTF